MTAEQLRQIMPGAGKRADVYAGPLSVSMDRFNIDTPIRQSAFLANVAVESGQLLYVRELASGEAYDTGRKAVALGNTPEDDGDGPAYKGRGLIQITGQYNYRQCGKGLGLPILEMPELLEQPEYAALSAAWFWHWKKLDRYADARNFLAVCGVINRGSAKATPDRINHYRERLDFYARAKLALGAA